MLIITSSFHLALTWQSCRESEEVMATKQRRLIGATGEGRSPVLAMLVLVTFAVTAPFAEAQGSPSSSNNNNNNNNNNPYNGLNNFNPSMAIVIVVLISAFFFLGFFSIYIRQCAGNSSGGASTAGARLGAGLSRRQRGLDPALLETFPTLVYSEVKGLKIGKGALECAVCLSEFEDNETLRLLPACNHAFHPDCIDAWLTSHVTCPVCRANLAETSAEHAALETDPEATASDSEAVLADRPNTAGAGGDQTDNAMPQRPDFVAITVDDSTDGERRLSLPPLPPPELMDLKRLTSQRQAARAKSVARSPRFPRSHSTGHSVVQPGENPDRYTLRLPEHIRREIVAAGQLQRTKSFPANAGAAGEGSSRGGWRMGGGGGEGSSRGGRSTRLGRSDRWPSLLMRTLSLRVPAWRRGDGEGSVKKAGGGDMEGSSKGKFAAVRGPFDCLGGGAKTDAAASPAVNESPSAPLARV